MIVIDCRDEGWDNVLYESLAEKKPVELIYLHNSYEGYMKQMAHHYSMEFISHSQENRGGFRRPNAQ